MVQMKNRVSGLLMETGVSYNKQRLHKVGYFAELMTTNEEVHESIRPLLKLSRDMIRRSQKLDYALVSSVRRRSLISVEAMWHSGRKSITKPVLIVRVIFRCEDN